MCYTGSKLLYSSTKHVASCHRLQEIRQPAQNADTNYTYTACKKGKHVDAHLKQDSSRLGARLAVYQPGTAKILLLSIFLILLSLPCTICGFMNTTTSTTVYSHASSLEEWLMTVGLGMGLVGIIAIILALRNRKMRVEVYEQGFVATSKQGTKEIRWDQITHVWHKLEEIVATTMKDPQTGASTPETRKSSLDVYAVQCADGTTCEIDTSFYGLSTFAPVLEQTYPRYLFPQALASYQAGTPLSFGTLTVSSTGVRNTQSDGDVQLVWGRFEAIEIDKKKGNITIRRGAGSELWSTISLTDTPNVAVFEALVNTLASKQ